MEDNLIKLQMKIKMNFIRQQFVMPKIFRDLIGFFMKNFR